MATFRRVVLAQPEIASIVFEFQFGVYEDVRPVFCACNELVEFDAARRWYECDASFRKPFTHLAKSTHYKRHSFRFDAYALHTECQRDARLPLHIAVTKGLVPLIKRILRCRPDLASEDTIFLAFVLNRLAVVELLLEARASVPELHRRASASIVVPMDSRFPFGATRPTGFLSKILAQRSSRALRLLARFGPHPDNVVGPPGPLNQAREWVVRVAMRHATLENATLALDFFPWLYYPALLDDMTLNGLLPLVRSLHERGFACSRDAMDQAATNGHLEVVQFLHFNRTEGCTTNALDGAIVKGHLDVARFLIAHRTEGASLNILDEAAAKGHLDVVQYLHSLGTFRCTVAAVDGAVSRGHLDVVTFLLTHRNEGGSRGEVVQKALANGHLQLAKYLLSLGYPFPTGDIPWFVGVFRKPEMLGVIRLCMENGAPWDVTWMVHAHATGNVQLVQFLHEHSDCRCHPDMFAVRICASPAKRREIARYYLANCTARISLDGLTAVLEDIDVATRMLQRHPELRDDSLLWWSCAEHKVEATRFLLAAGIGKPRECLLKLAGRRQHVSESKLLLPYCMDATDHLDNVTFLLDLLALPDRRRTTILHLITQELTYQGRKTSQTIQLAPSVAARASTLLEAGHVVDGALALVIGHLHATNATTTIEELEEKTAMVLDAELKAQLRALLTSMRKRTFEIE